MAAADVVRLLDLIAAALRAMKDGADARTQLELALVKAAEPALEPSTRPCWRGWSAWRRTPAPPRAAAPGRPRARGGRAPAAAPRAPAPPRAAQPLPRRRPKGMG